MTIDIEAVPRRVQYTGSGTGPYAFTFNILDETDIAVYRDDTLLTLTTDYTVTINGDGTGSVTTVASQTGHTVTIIGARPYARLTDYATGGDFFAETINDELDSLQIQIQQLLETTGRTPKLSPTTAFSGEATFPEPVASTLIGWNSTADGFQTYAAGDIAPDILVSPFMETVLDDADAATARATLAVPSKSEIQEQTYTAFTTGGTSTAYTLTPTPALTSLVANQRFRIKFHTAAGSNPTLSVSGLTAKNLKTYGASSTKRAVTSSDIPTGWVSDVEYDGTDYVVLDVATPVKGNQSFRRLFSFPASSTTRTVTAQACVTRNPTTGTIRDIGSINLTSGNLSAAQSGSTANGRDQAATFSAGVIFEYVISGEGVANALLYSTSETAPTLPSGYTEWAIVGPIRWGGSNFDFNYRYKGNTCAIDGGVNVLSGGSATSETSVSLSGYVPASTDEYRISATGTATADASANLDITLSLRSLTGVNQAVLTCPYKGASAGASNMPTWLGQQIWLTNIAEAASFFYQHTVNVGSSPLTNLVLRGFRYSNGAN